MTITITISMDGDGDDYEVVLNKKPKPAPAEKTWADCDDETMIWYLGRRTPAALAMLKHLTTGATPTTQELVSIMGLNDTSEVAGAISWPGRDAYAKGLPLPWSWNGAVLEMSPDAQERFRRAFEES